MREIVHAPTVGRSLLRVAKDRDSNQFGATALKDGAKHRRILHADARNIQKGEITRARRERQQQRNRCQSA